MRRVTFVAPELLPVPPTRGGAVEYWMHEASKGLAAAGWKVRIFSRPAEAEADAGIERVGLRWTAVEAFMERARARCGPGNPLRLLPKFVGVWSYGRQVSRALGEDELLYVHNDPNLLLALRHVAARRVVLHMHNDHLSLRAMRPLYRWLLKRVDRVLFVSHFLQTQALARFPELKGRCAVIENATDTGFFRPAAKQAVRPGRTLLFAGRLQQIKGVHVLLEAFRKVREAIPDARLVIAGSSFFEGARPNGYELELRQLAQGLGESLEFTGFVPHADLVELYREADVIVVPSVWDEPFGLVVIEAMACGRCVVASRVGGIPEIVTDGKDGLLMPAGDVDALATTLISILEDDLRRSSIGAAARETAVARYDWSRLISQLDTELRS